jgi:hypothetical protein
MAPKLRGVAHHGPPPTGCPGPAFRDFSGKTRPGNAQILIRGNPIDAPLFGPGGAMPSRGQRCLVVTDGFYEWKKLDANGKLKQPYAIAVADRAQMAMAGLWAKWKSPTSGEEVLSCTILTCGPNKAMGELHDRMPVILAENDWPKWLGEEPASEQELLVLLKPCADEALKI